jgi:hypothetical protein
MDLFLDPIYKDQFDDRSVLIVGQIKECPRTTNGKRYRIEWKNEGMPLPAGLQVNWLMLYYINGTNENRRVLYAAIERYDECPTTNTEGSICTTKEESKEENT